MPLGSTPLAGARNSERLLRLATAVFGIFLAFVAGHLGLVRLGGGVRTLSYDMPLALGYDLPFGLAHPAGSSDQVRIVYLDDLDGQFIDRRSQAKLLDLLNEAGARAVVYDLIFDLPSEDPAVDQEFAAAMLRFRGVDEAGQPLEGKPARAIFLACGRKTISQTGVTGEQLIPPTDELLAAADDFGLVPLIHDKKFTVRELTTGTPDEASVTWKAAVALGAHLEENSRLTPRWINYVGPPPNPHAKPHDKDVNPAIPSFNASDILRSSVPTYFNGKVVVVGAKPGIVGAAAGVDLFSTPFHRFDLAGELPLTSGVEIQATILTNLIEGNWLTRMDPRHDDLMISIASILAGILFSRLRPLHAVFAAILLVLLLVATGTLMVQQRRVWFLWSLVAFIQIPVAAVWGTASNFYIERFFRAKLGLEQRQLREAFAKYLSPQMLDRLTAEGFHMRVGGEKIQAAMMFTDLENFTDLCERVGDPERIVSSLNDYFEHTTCHIFDDDGVVIKFIGDAIFACWGAPLPEPQAALKAVRSAWKLSQSDKVVVDGTVLKTRIGVHYGEVVAGNIGSARRVDYTMIGDAVNLAARLESLNKTVGTEILISDEVCERLNGEFLTRLVGRLKVKGRKKITVIHEVLGPANGEEPPRWLSLYRQAQEALAANDPAKARELFTAVSTERGEPDGPSGFFLKRLESGDIIPDGVVEMTEK